MKNRFQTIATAVAMVCLIGWGCATGRRSAGPSMSVTPDDLTFINPTDTIGNSRTTINSNDWLLANDASNLNVTVGTLTGSSHSAVTMVTNDSITYLALTGQVFTAGLIDSASLSNTTVVAGLYTTADVVFDEDGRAIAATNGVSGGGSGGTIQDATTLSIHGTDTGTVAITALGIFGTNNVDLQTSRAAAAAFNKGSFSVIGGGHDNQIVRGVTYSVIGGGFQNDITTGSTDDHFIGGGRAHNISGAGGDNNGIGWGNGHSITATADNNGIVCGSGNSISGANQLGFVGGGGGCSLQGNIYSVVAGGDNNDVLASADRSGILSGEDCSIQGDWNNITGGQDNDVDNAGVNWSHIGGGFFNKIAADYSSILGGLQNDINGAGATGYNTILGGLNCTIASGASASMAWGSDADIDAAVAGSCAMGTDPSVLHAGTFIWSDSSTTPFSSTAADQFLIEADGGVGIGTNAPQGTLGINGDIVLFEMAAPSTPTTNSVRIFVDAADGDLKAIDDNGEVITIANFTDD